MKTPQQKFEQLLLVQQFLLHMYAEEQLEKEVEEERKEKAAEEKEEEDSIENEKELHEQKRKEKNWGKFLMWLHTHAQSNIDALALEWVNTIIILYNI